MYGINYSQVRGRMSGATSAALSRARSVSGRVTQARGRASAATGAALGRAKAASASVTQAPGRVSAATKTGVNRAKAVSSSVAKAPGRVSSSIAKNPKRKIAAVGGGAAFGSYLVGGRRGRGVDKTDDRPTGMYGN